MKSSSLKKASITLPSELEKSLKKLAQEEHRTFSGVLQEAGRYYLGIRQLEALQNKLAIKTRELGIHTEEDLDRVIHDMRSK